MSDIPYLYEFEYVDNRGETVQAQVETTAGAELSDFVAAHLIAARFPEIGDNVVTVQRIKPEGEKFQFVVKPRCKYALEIRRYGYRVSVDPDDMDRLTAKLDCAYASTEDACQAVLPTLTDAPSTIYVRDPDGKVTELSVMKVQPKPIYKLTPVTD